MKNYSFLLFTITILTFFQIACSEQRTFSSGGLHHVDACMEKINRIIDHVHGILSYGPPRDDAFKAQIIAYISIATIDSGTPRIHAMAAPVSPAKAKADILATFAALEAKSYHETSPHEQSRKLYAAAQQYKTTISRPVTESFD